MKHKPATVYGGKVGAKTKPKRHTISKRVSKTAWLCKDGPMDGQTLYLESGHTLVFTMANQTGRYVEGEWKCA